MPGCGIEPSARRLRARFSGDGSGRQKIEDHPKTDPPGIPSPPGRDAHRLLVYIAAYLTSAIVLSAAPLSDAAAFWFLAGIAVLTPVVAGWWFPLPTLPLPGRDLPVVAGAVADADRQEAIADEWQRRTQRAYWRVAAWFLVLASYLVLPAPGVLWHLRTVLVFVGGIHLWFVYLPQNYRCPACGASVTGDDGVPFPARGCRKCGVVFHPRPNFPPMIPAPPATPSTLPVVAAPPVPARATVEHHPSIPARPHLHPGAIHVDADRIDTVLDVAFQGNTDSEYAMMTVRTPRAALDIEMSPYFDPFASLLA